MVYIQYLVLREKTEDCLSQHKQAKIWVQAILHTLILDKHVGI